MVELARSLIALKQPNDACQALAEVKRRYPKAPQAVQNRAAAARTHGRRAARRCLMGLKRLPTRQAGASLRPLPVISRLLPVVAFAAR